MWVFLSIAGYKVQLHHLKARTGVAAPLKRSKIISSRGVRCSCTIGK